MPVEITYLVALLVTICVFFIVLKRPIYEGMLAGYIVLVAMTNQWGAIGEHIYKTSTNTLFYAIVAFMVVAQIFTGTKVIDACIEVVLSLFGRIKGGTGYVALLVSSFMGALSGSAAGNVAATGVFTIPAMKRAGFPDYLASNICMASSTMGNMIPPAGIIVASFGILTTLYGEDTYTMSQFWLLMWGISLWFILQRAVTIFVFCKIHHIEALPPQEIPKFGDAIRKGWKSMMIPVVILLPFLLDAQLKEGFFTDRLTAAGASALSSCVLLFTPGIAAVYALFIIRKNMKVGPKSIVALLTKGTKSIVPVSATIFFAYCISNLFESLNVGANIGNMIAGWNLGLVPLALILPLFTAILGMILPGSSQVAIFGTAMVSVMAAAGANPFLIAGMLPVICGAMEGMTPPLALCMYTAMGISGSGMKETTKNCIIWCVLHYLLSVICMLGVLPVFGMV
ncbi:MAG: TRAP transporter large permease subunit [Agathobaculum sp.]|jgi:C4-dicarboxylate transporter DctM subunit|uniref:TRAP transporter large permease subunit n=1 Tax=Agathobaculum sp. TaxID=2048138 RepID=UPI003D8F0897